MTSQVLGLGLVGHGLGLGLVGHVLDFITVSESTHVAGHILHLVIIRKDTVIRYLLVGGVLSDHALIQFKLCLEQLRPDVQYVNCRTWRRNSGIHTHT